jgi:glycosyltransferase involved in cell wall biosynthesis
MIRRVAAVNITINHEPERGMICALRDIFGADNVLNVDFMRTAESMSLPTMNTWVLSQCLTFKPDWVWFQVQDTSMIGSWVIRELRRRLPGCVVSHWMGDARENVCDYLTEICRDTHLTLISSVGQIPMFQQAGASKVEYLQVGLDLPEHADFSAPPSPVTFQVPDVVFCAKHAGYQFPGTRDRIEGIQALMQSEIDVGIVGTGWTSGFPVVGSCHRNDQTNVYRHAKVALSINHLNTIERYYSDRQIIAMASGTPVVCKYVPGLEREFTHGVHCLWYDHPDELVGHVKSLLSDPDLRARIGQAGRAEILKSHTWRSRFLSVIPTIEQIQKELTP